MLISFYLAYNRVKLDEVKVEIFKMDNVRLPVQAKESSYKNFPSCSIFQRARVYGEIFKTSSLISGMANFEINFYLKCYAIV
jgi:hypothetical protein